MIELMNEIIPFGVGIIALSPILMFIMRPSWPRPIRSVVTLFASLIVGVAMSFIMGELFGEIEQALTAIIIDTSLVYTGSQVAYWLVWREIQHKRAENAQAVVTK